MLQMPGRFMNLGAFGIACWSHYGSTRKRQPTIARHRTRGPSYRVSLPSQASTPTRGRRHLLDSTPPGSLTSPSLLPPLLPSLITSSLLVLPPLPPFYSASSGFNSTLSPAIFCPSLSPSPKSAASPATTRRSNRSSSYHIIAWNSRESSLGNPNSHSCHPPGDRSARIKPHRLRLSTPRRHPVHLISDPAPANTARFEVYPLRIVGTSH